MPGHASSESPGHAQGAPHGSLAAPPASDAPRLITVISTEEEFDWSKPFDRESQGVSALAHVGAGQAVFDAAGVRPIYVVDYPVAANAGAAALLREIAGDGRCEIGAHLHPWVTPPHHEQLGPRNSFPGNLPRELERAKLQSVCDAIERTFGTRPRCYQAGRYGFGPGTATILEELGFDVDVSASPGFDFSFEGGPDYLERDAHARWFGASRALLAVPMTGAIVGWLPGLRTSLYRWAHAPLPRALRSAAVLARIGLAERIRLSPEGFSSADLAHLVRFLLDRGVRVFALGMHSPTFKPGCTPYVADAAQLARFLDTLRHFYEYFLGELGGRHLTPTELRLELLERCPPTR